MTMSLFLTGIVLGLMVSVPPGPNTALCVNLGCEGVRRAVPVITCAALADALYSLLAASGILVAAHASVDVFAWLSPCLMLGTAVLIWLPAPISPRAIAGIALLNPATVAIWLSLSSIPAAHALSVSDLLMRPLPVALGTAAWFTLVALMASQLSAHLTRGAIERAQRVLAMALAVFALVGLAAAMI